MLPAAFTKRMATILGGEYPAFLDCYGRPPVRGLRVNTLRIAPADFEKMHPWRLAPSGVLPEGYVLLEEAAGIGRHPYHMAGVIYMQEPSAMAPVAALPVRSGMRILDVCASPGGKSTAMAARMGGDGLLVSNEIVPNRAKVLSQNIQRMGIRNAVVTNAKPEALCEALSAAFDIVLVDAPCSGEGMFRKDEAAVQAWSEAHVLACAARQRAILQSAQKAVKPGGVLLYATCTFSTEENEDVVADFLQEHTDFALLEQKRLYPHRMPGEGQFYAKLLRTGEAESFTETPRTQGSGAQRKLAADALLALFPTLCTDTLSVLPDGRVFLLPSDMPAGLYAQRMLLGGLEAGEIKKDRFEPAHALFQALGAFCTQRVALDSADVRTDAFLRGETLSVSGVSGFAAVCVDGFPLGFGKAVDGVLKNRLPKGLRR
ncbi:MAG: RsmB/NOP family class I SAM-dependent RNA methyltransferase [Clostridia bacterium]|nr:RsmB/NOP family class I SAM-dependent RNA methyltransferase [Clostridia bacterium]